MTEVELAQALASTRLELRAAERERDEWRQRAEMQIAARRVAVRARQQADDDADRMLREIERLRAVLGMDCCEGGIAA